MTTIDRPITWWRSTVVASHHSVYGATCSGAMTPVANPSAAGITPRSRLRT